MAENDLDLLPPEGGSEEGQIAPVFNQTNNIGQFIQLVNKNTQLPDGDQLASYNPEDKEWVKRRMEIEQEHRHGLFEQLAKNQHELDTSSANLAHKNNLFRFAGGFLIILFSLVLTGVLLYFKLGWISLGPLALIMSAPLSTSLGSYVTERIKGLSKIGSDEVPPKTPEA
jgi:hypothetical protein